MIDVETQPLSHTLQQVDEAAARWSRLLSDPRWSQVRNACGVALRAQQMADPLHSPVTLRLKGEGAQLLVVLDETQWPVMRLLKQMSDQSRQAAIVHLWANQALHQLRDMGCDVERFHLDANALLRSAARVCVKLGDCAMDLYPEKSSDRFAEGLQKFLTTMPLPKTARLAQWPLASAITLAERSFSMSRMRTLKVGDWVLWAASDAVTLRVHGGVSGGALGMVAACQLKTKELTMEEALHEEVSAVVPEEALQSLTTEDVTETVQSTYAGLQVHVRFEIDGPAMTVAQATSLVPGEVLVLPTSVDQSQIRLRCQGRCFAYGELVNVGGQMGVRIIEVGGHDV